MSVVREVFIDILFFKVRYFIIFDLNITLRDNLLVKYSNFSCHGEKGLVTVVREVYYQFIFWGIILRDNL